MQHSSVRIALIIGNTFAWPLNDNISVRLFSRVMGEPCGRARALLFNGVVRFFFTHGVVTKLPPEVWRMYLAPFQN